MKKYILTLLVILTLCVTVCITAPKADAATVASGTCGTNLKWTLDDQGTLTITGTGAMTDWTWSSNAPWYSNRSSIKKVTIGSGVTTIGSQAFDSCTGLTSVTIPDSVTIIGDLAFYDCMRLTSVTIPDGVTSIGNMAFYYCTRLTSVTIPDSVTTIGSQAFDGCMSLTGVYISDLKAWCEIEFASVFSNPLFYAKKLYLNGQLVADMVIPDGVTTIGSSAFSGCDSLTSVTIPDSVTTIGECAFYNCTELTSVTIPDSVTTIGGSAFYDCDGLTSVTIPDSVTTIDDWAFSGCTGLAEITFEGNAPAIGASAFYGVTATAYYSDRDATWTEAARQGYGGNITWNAMTYTDISGTCGDNLTWVLDDQGTLTISGTGAMTDWTWSSNAPWYSNRSSVKKVTIGSGVTTIGSYAFSWCTGLTSVTIGNSVTTIGSHAFYYCTGLTGIWVDPNNENYSSDSYGVLFDKSKTILIQAPGAIAGAYTIPDSVTTIGEDAFYNCAKLTSVTIPDSVTTIGYAAFYDCTGLTSVTIGNGVTTIGDSAFLNCKGLTSVTIGNSVTTIGCSAFYDCTGLTGVYISDLKAWCEIDFGGNVANPLCWAKNLYLNNKLVTDLVIPDSVTTIGYEAFLVCTSLTSVTIPDSVTTIGGWAFAYCTGLTSVTIGNSVTTVGDWAFDGCTGLTSVTIPDSVTTIRDGAFSDCTSLTSVTYCGTEEQWNNISIGSYNSALTGASRKYHDWTAATCTTPKTCTICGTTEGSALDHSYENGSCIHCGADDPNYVYEKFDVAYARMILGNALEFQFAVPQSARDNWDGTYAIIEKEWADGTTTTKTISADQWGKVTIGGVKYWAIVYDGLAAKEMADYFYVTIYSADGEPLSNMCADSVRLYVARTYGAQNAIGKTMVVDMLYYGAAAQKKFNYGTDDLATAMLTNAQKASATTQLATLNDNQFKGQNYMGTRLVLESRIQMQVAFKGLTSDMYAIYSYTDNSGAVQNVRVDGTNFVTAGSMKGIELDALVYADARAAVTVIVYNPNGSIYAIATDSIESYALRSTTGEDVFTALMKFADSAKAYLYG